MAGTLISGHVLFILYDMSQIINHVSISFTIHIVKNTLQVLFCSGHAQIKSKLEISKLSLSVR